MMVRKVSILLTVAMTVALAGCSSKPQNHTTIKKGDKTITILEPENTAGTEEVKVEKIEEYKELETFDWQDEDKLLVKKRNRNVGMIAGEEGEMFYPNNLYIFDKNSGEFEVIKEEAANHYHGMFSPDKKYIFYKTNEEEVATGYIMDSQGKNKVSITADYGIPLTSGRWVDNEKVIYKDFEDNIYEADLSGKIYKIPDLMPDSGYDVFRDGNEIYSITGDNSKFEKYNLISKEKTVLDENVKRFCPSKAYSRIAYIKSNDYEMENLILLDNNFSKKTLAEETFIGELAWSPDNTRLVFSIISDDVSATGIYLSDQKTGNTHRIALFEDIYSLSWSPSGKQIAVCRYGDDSIFYTNILTLNK